MLKSRVTLLVLILMGAIIGIAQGCAKSDTPASTATTFYGAGS
jgi:hypothetical protein